MLLLTLLEMSLMDRIQILKTLKVIQKEDPLDQKSAQFAKLKPAAKALLLLDEKKACAIANFVKETVFRELDPVKVDEYQNCAYQAALQQISNLECVFNTATDEPFTATDFRNQVVFNMALHADDIYPKLMESNMLPTAYKAWLHNQLDTQEPVDEVAIFGIRVLLNVSTFSQS